MPEFLDHLTEPQRAAATHVEGPLLVLAGPGSGKTRVVTHRIAYLLQQGVGAHQILALTFTNKAAEEMRHRVARLVPGRSVWISTFHRFCARLLRQFAPLVGLGQNYSIYDTADSTAALLRAIEQTGVNNKYFSADRIAKAIGDAKSSTVTAEQYEPRHGDPLGPIIAQVYPVYQQQLLRSNAVDFDDLLLHVATILRDNPEVRSQLDERYRFILVDEYQDTNLAQYAIARAMAIDYPNLAVTGDPDQSIYGWRGANLNNILEFEHDYPNTTVIRLEENFRSTQRIVRVAAQLIANNRRRKRKTLFTNNPPGDLVRQARYPTYIEEAQDIAQQIAAAVRDEQRSPKDFAIFYRTNAISRSLEHALRAEGLPYQVVHGVAFYQRKEIKDVMAYLQLINNPRNDAALLRIINTPPRSIGRQTLLRLQQFATAQRLPLLEAAATPDFLAGLHKPQAKAIREFLELQDQLSRLADQPMEEIIGRVLTYSKYAEYLRDNQDESDVDRAENVRELLNEAREFDTRYPQGPWLEAFLERTALVNDTDDWDQQSAKVSLMTLHAAKGLEFPVVYIVGVEEGLIPHERSRHTDEGLEEERRLLFVGITRAREKLQLSHCDMRLRGGTRVAAVTSPMLMELPRDELELVGYQSTLYSQIAPWDDDLLRDDSYAEPVYRDVSAISDGEEPPDDQGPRSPRAMKKTAAAPGATQRRKKAPAPSGKFMTAADMLGGRSTTQNTTSNSVESFAQGMLVNHPQYGPGTIVSLSGQGTKRSATVRFFRSADEERRFILAFSPLTPIQSDAP